MSSESIRPSTLDGIKRLAKSLKVERGIQHVKALDNAAQAAGYQNFHHARKTLLIAETDKLQAPFVSPGRGSKEPTEKGEPQQSPTSTSQRNSVGYVQTLVGPRRRPNGRMPINAHTEVGQLLKSVLVVTYHRKGVFNRVNAMRCELDEWVQREYNHEELPNERFFELYYHDSDWKYPQSLPEPELERHAESLTKARRLLEQHYPDSPPLRSLLKKMDAALKSLRTWT